VVQWRVPLIEEKCLTSLAKSSFRSRDFSFQCLRFEWHWVHLVRRPLFGLLYQPRMMDDKCGSVDGMIYRRNRNTRRKPASVPLCPTQIPHDLTYARTRAAAVRIWRLPAWAMPRPMEGFTSRCSSSERATEVGSWKHFDLRKRRWGRNKLTEMWSAGLAAPLGHE
jgi:hypothetical protein